MSPLCALVEWSMDPSQLPSQAHPTCSSPEPPPCPWVSLPARRQVGCLSRGSPGTGKYILIYCLMVNKKTLGKKGRSNCAWRPPHHPPLDIGFLDETVRCCSWTTIPYHLGWKGLSFTLCSPPLITPAAKHHPAPSGPFSSSSCP